MASSEEDPNVSSPVSEEEKGTNLPTFPLARYWYHGDFRFYYAYGNTPATDFLDSCAGEREPSILALGCGDIRSCFYTLWKNFDFSISNAPKRFEGVHFTLNDNSAAVLARNIVFLHLCLQLPSGEMERKKWLSAMWAIWYCHELYFDHLVILNDSLMLLLKFSTSLEQWASTDNPMQHLVSFTSSTCLADIAHVWKMWFYREVSVGSAKHMHVSRNQELKQRGMIADEENYISFSYSRNSIYIHGLTSDSILKEASARQPEVKSYFSSGNCFAESVLNLPQKKKTHSINLTLYEKQDGVYNLHYHSMPFSGFYHTVQFSSQYLKSTGRKQLPYEITISPTSFQSKPFLANSVQQFTMWVQSANRVLMKKDILISFLFNTQHALTFCQELQQKNQRERGECGGPKYSVIATSNLMDHLGPPNLVLATLPLLKDNSFLYTTTLLYKDVANTIEEFLDVCFGFDCKMFPVVFGARCINHEGAGFASSTLIKPTPPDMALQPERVLIWEKVSAAQALTLSLLPRIEPGNITDAVLNIVQSSTYTFLLLGNRVLNSICIESGLQILIRFISLSGIALCDYAFWEPLSTALVKNVRPHIYCLQTQMLLHDIHAHLTVTEDDCPLCKKIPLKNSMALFCADVPLSSLKSFSTPNFIVMVHKSVSSVPDLFNEARAGRDVHIFDCLDCVVSKNSLQIQFFAPLKLVKENYKAIVTLIIMQPIKILAVAVTPTVLLRSLQAPFIHYWFLKPDYSFVSHQKGTFMKNSSLGVVYSHICDSFRSETEVTLSNSTLEALATHKLSPVRLSSNELQISCNSLRLQLKYCFPINYNTVNIKLSKAKGKMVVSCHRQAHNFDEENTCYVINPDHELSILPFDFCMDVIAVHSKLQFTNVETKFVESCKLDLSYFPPSIKVKLILQCLFKNSKCSYFHLLSPGKGIVLGYIIVNKVLFDYEHRTPAFDIAFCFLNQHDNSEVVTTKWEKNVYPTNAPAIANIFVNDTELEVLQKTFEYFARRTNGSLQSAGNHSRYNILRCLKVDNCFTRAVVYFLLCDPDIEFALPVATYLNTPSTASSVNPQDVASGTKCEFCEKPSVTTKMCARCKSVSYCSKNCQMKHWAVHRSLCTPENDSKPSKTSPSSTSIEKSALRKESRVHPLRKTGSQHLKCLNCKKISNFLKTCTRCGAVQYCGKNCQTKHWPEHRMTCKGTVKAQPDEKGFASKPDYHDLSLECTYCKKTTDGLKKCTRCGAVQYCNQDCQRKHWPEHKEICIQV